MYNLVDKKYSIFHLHYHVLGKVGSGNFGLVIKVRDKNSEEIFAVKKIPLIHNKENE